jgi:hypothetical protein
MRSIVFLDLDGTLWDHEKIPASAKKAITLAQANGHKILSNTGRSRCEVSDVLFNLHLDGYCFSAGTEILLGDKRILYQPLSVETIDYFLEALQKSAAGITLEGSAKSFINEKKRAFLARNHAANREGNNIAEFLDLSMLRLEDKKQIMKISVHSDVRFDIRTILENAPQEMVFTPFNSSLSKNGDLQLCGEITLSAFNKATAIDQVCSYFREPFQTIAVGDSENDLTMLNHTDISVAMGNALDVVKKACTLTTDSLYENGLYNAFQKLSLF